MLSNRWIKWRTRKENVVKKSSSSGAFYAPRRKAWKREKLPKGKFVLESGEENNCRKNTLIEQRNTLNESVKQRKEVKKTIFLGFSFAFPFVSRFCVSVLLFLFARISRKCVCEPLELSALFTNTSASAYCHTACVVVVVGGVSSVSGGCATVCVRSSNREKGIKQNHDGASPREEGKCRLVFWKVILARFKVKVRCEEILRKRY